VQWLSDNGSAYTAEQTRLFARTLAFAFEHYNEQHPQCALNYRSPREFRRLAATLI
jgi:putative transposase